MIPLLTKTKPMMITVANEEKIYSDAKCQGVEVGDAKGVA